MLSNHRMPAVCCDVIVITAFVNAEVVLKVRFRLRQLKVEPVPHDRVLVCFSVEPLYNWTLTLQIEPVGRLLPLTKYARLSFAPAGPLILRIC